MGAHPKGPQTVGARGVFQLTYAASACSGPIQKFGLRLVRHRSRELGARLGKSPPKWGLNEGPARPTLAAFGRLALVVQAQHRQVRGSGRDHTHRARRSIGEGPKLF
jgi:hypothetical protein